MKNTNKDTKQITLRMDRVEPSGEFSGMYENRRFFIRDTIPGEKIVANVVAKSQQRPEGFAEIFSIEEGSPERVPVACEHAGICGGCDWQHIQDKTQLTYKKQLVQQALSPYKTLSHVSVEECQASPNPYEYRYVAKWVSKMHLGKVWLGAFARKSHDIVSTTGCRVHRASLEKVGDVLRELLNQSIGQFIAPHLRYVVARESSTTEEIAVSLIGWRKPPQLDLFANALQEKKVCTSLLFHLNAQKSDSLFDYQSPHEVLFGTEGVTEEIASCRVLIPMQAFLQINPSQAKHLRQKAQESSRITAGVAIELYAGVSQLSLSLAKQFPKMRWFSIEKSLQAVEVAKQIKERLSLENIYLYQGDAVEIFEKVSTVDVIWLNPPRAGASPEVTRAILRAAPQRIIYTSCSAKTFSRDAALFAEGGYRLETVTPFDMFPQTAHVEMVGVFQKEAGQITGS